jgi:hypothetical protein
MIYCCEKCDAEFLKKFNYERHINRKTPCMPEEKKQLEIDKCTCIHCTEIYSSVKALKVHLTTCKFRPSGEDELKQLVLKLNDKLTEQNNEIKKLQNMHNKPNIINNNITNNIQQNIIVIPYGKEDLSFLTLKDYTKILKKGCYSIPELLKMIHCNDDRPEFKNIYIKNYKDEYIFTYDGKDWGVERKDDVFANMIENKKNFLESKLDDFQEQLPITAINMFKKFLDRSDNDEVINSIKDDLKNLFYKNRNHVVKNTKNTKAIKNIPENNTVTTKDINDNGKKPTKKQGVDKKPNKKTINIDNIAVL